MRFLRALAICFLLGCASLAANAADAPSITGNWQVHLVLGGGSYENTITCSFTQKETVLNGSCNTAAGPADVTGTVYGNKVHWSYKTDFAGNTVTPTYDGLIDASSTPTKIAGTVSVPEASADGNFTATATQ
jgi:hypothetical protein